MEEEGVRVSGSRDTLRLVTHSDFHEEKIDQVTAAFSRALRP
jgi:threonine aldolase